MPQPGNKSEYGETCPPIEWRNTPVDSADTAWLLIQACFMWCACAAGLFGGVVGVLRGDKVAWLLIGATVLVFIPIVIGLTLWYWPDARQRITIDFEEHRVVFEHIRPYSRFLPERPAARVVCSFDEILTIEPRFIPIHHWVKRSFLRRNGTPLTIHTTRGRFVILARTPTADDLHEALESIAQGRVLPLRQRHWIPVVVGSAITFAVLVALFLFGVLP